MCHQKSQDLICRFSRSASLKIVNDWHCTIFLLMSSILSYKSSLFKRQYFKYWFPIQALPTWKINAIWSSFFSTCRYFHLPKFSIRFQGIISRGWHHPQCLQKSRLSVIYLRGVCMIYIGSIWVNKLSFASKKSDPLGCLQLMPRYKGK